MPHYLAIYFSFFNSLDKIILKKIKTIKFNNSFSQSFEINLFVKNKNVSNFYFNNIKKKKIRKFKLIYNKKIYLYDAYKLDKNKQTPLQKIIYKLYYSKIKKNYINDLAKSVRIHKAIDKLI